MSMKWHYANKSRKPSGPYLVEDLQKLMEAGKITESTLVWNGKTVKNWTSLNKIPSLLEELNPPETKPPPIAQPQSPQRMPTPAVPRNPAAPAPTRYRPPVSRPPPSRRPGPPPPSRPSRPLPPSTPSRPSVPSFPSRPSRPLPPSTPSRPSVPSFPSRPLPPSTPSRPSVPSFPSRPSRPAPQSRPSVPSFQSRAPPPLRKSPTPPTMMPPSSTPIKSSVPTPGRNDLLSQIRQKKALRKTEISPPKASPAVPSQTPNPKPMRFGNGPPKSENKGPQPITFQSQLTKRLQNRPSSNSINNKPTQKTSNNEQKTFEKPFKPTPKPFSANGINKTQNKKSVLENVAKHNKEEIIQRMKELNENDPVFAAINKLLF